ncbi:MAG: hypothetical protein KGV51_06330, partial [Moraxellaceae bacterium]|nr:hypothetical protein [Moraxellaceae bacterium]
MRTIIEANQINEQAGDKKADNGIAIGNNSYTKVADGVALGSKSVADRKSLKTIKGSALTKDDVLSDNALLKDAKVYGLATATENDKTAIANTVKGDLGAVSVGTKTKTRQIINVAAGRDNSDAVNVAQLKAVANTGLIFAGNDSTDATQITRKLGEKLTIKGGHNSTDVSDKNLYVAEDKANNTLHVKMAEKPEFTQVKVGNDTTNNPITIGTVNNNNIISGLSKIIDEP